MNNNTNSVPFIIIRVKEVLWDILSQWKLILLISLAMGIGLAGIRFARDTKNYRENMENSSQADEDAGLTSQERIDKILESLEGSGKDTVAYLANQERLVRQETEYIANSIWLNCDVENQRTLTLSYYLKGSENADLQALSDVYFNYLGGRECLYALGQQIAPEAELKYISELITKTTGRIPDSEAKGTLLKIVIVLPRETDASAVEQVVTNALTQENKLLVGPMGDHEISFVEADEAFVYSALAMDKKAAITNTINSQRTNMRNFTLLLNSTQKEALDKIISIIREERETKEGVQEDTVDASTQMTDTDVTVVPPRFNVTFALIGFLFGVFLYVIAYLAVIIVRDRMMYAENASAYTGSRLLGEIYYDKHYTGLSVLLHSRMVDSLRYRGKDDTEHQLLQSADKLAAVCEHAQIGKICILCAAGPDREVKKITDRLIHMLQERKLDVEKLDAEKEISERDLLSRENVLSVVGRETARKDILNLTALFSEYDINQPGCVFIGDK